MLLGWGGFVAYQLAHLYPDAVQKVALVAAGVCLEEKDTREGLFKVSDMLKRTLNLTIIVGLWMRMPKTSGGS